jgi:hypothetical protein
VSGGVWHPDGCRCSGCRTPAARTPAAPRPAAPRPVYRSAPRSHAYNCPCNRCVQVRAQNKGGVGILLPAALIIGVVTVVGFWPAMVWHGDGGPTGTAWRWNIDSTVAELTYFGAIAFVTVVIWLCRKYAYMAGPDPTALPQPDRWWEGPEYQRAALKQAAKRPAGEPLLPRPPDTPICLHRNAIRVESVLDKDQTVAWWCPDCEETLDPGFRSSELKPDRWPAVRKQDTHGTMPRYAAVMRIGEQTFDLGRYHARVLAIRACQKRPEWYDTQWLEVSGREVVTACRQSDGTEVTFAVIDGK